MISIFVDKERRVRLEHSEANGADVVVEVLVPSTGRLLGSV
jgi:hypothetical protein